MVDTAAAPTLSWTMLSNDCLVVGTNFVDARFC